MAWLFSTEGFLKIFGKKETLAAFIKSNYISGKNMIFVFFLIKKQMKKLSFA